MPEFVEAYGGEPIVAGLMKLVGLWVDDENGKPARFPKNFVIEAREGSLLTVYVEEPVVRDKTEQEVNAIVREALDTTTQRNKTVKTHQIPYGQFDCVEVKSDCTVEVK